MAFGLVTLNDDGVNLIDEDFKSMCVVAQGSTSTGPGSPVQTTLNYAGINPMLAVDTHGVEFGIIAQGDVGGTFYWSVARGDGSSTAMPFDYWIFDNVPATPPSGYGMLVKNAAGQIVFNSNNKYLRPQFAPAGGVNAIITCNGAVRIHSADMGDGTWSTDWVLNTCWIDGSGVFHTGNLTYQTLTTATSMTYAPNTVRMVCDVTNY